MTLSHNYMFDLKLHTYVILTLNIIIDIPYTKSHITHSLRNKFHISHHNNVFDRSARPIWKVYFEFIQVVYCDTASPWQSRIILPLAVTWRAADPRGRALFWLPFDFQPWISLSGDANPKCLSTLAAPRFWGNTWWRGAILNAHRVFQCKTVFTGAVQTRDWSPIKLCFLTPHFFGGLHILICVYKYRYWCCVLWYVNVLSL